MQSTEDRANEVVVTGIGLLNPKGFGGDEIWRQSIDASTNREKRLAAFPVANYLSDRKLMKVISIADAYGLAAVEQAVKDAGIRKGNIDPWSIGMYVGAPPSRVSDNENYRECMEETRLEDGSFSAVRFGSTMQRARPTTLLQGLPNNVLCYGSIVSDLRGANSNYTSGEVSGLMALIQGAARVRRGQLCAAVVGGYQAQIDPVTSEIYRQNRWGTAENSECLPFLASGTLIGDGAAFLVVERSDHAEKRQAKPRLRYLGGSVFNDASGFDCLASEASAQLTERRSVGIATAIRRVCRDSGISLTQIGAFFPSAGGNPVVDTAELTALERIFSDVEGPPALVGSTRIWGHMLEASGIADIAMAGHLAAEPEIPECFRVLPSSLNKLGFAGRWQAEKKVFGVLQGTPTGEGAFVLMELEAV